MVKIRFLLNGYSPGKYSRCRFCRGRGCAGCDEEARQEAERLEAAAYAKQFPNGPEAITIPLDRIKEAAPIIGPDGLRAAFGDGGGGAAEVMDKLAALFGPPRPIGESADPRPVDRAIVACVGCGHRFQLGEVAVNGLCRHCAAEEE